MSDAFANAVNEAAFVINNLRVISPQLIGGGQPDLAGLKLLKKAGVKTVVNLRYAAKSNAAAGSSSFLRNRGDDDEIGEEQENCRLLDLKFVNISMQNSSAPATACLDKFISLFAEPNHLPIYAHCLHGQERTGLMLAAYRLKIEGWTVEAAYEEMLKYGFDPGRTILSDVLFKYASP